MNRILSIVIVSLFGPILALSSAYQDKTKKEAPTLTKADEAFLEKLLTKYLVDPTRLEYVSAPYTYRTPWGIALPGRRAGWLHRRGNRSRVYFLDGESVAAPDLTVLKKIDFVGDCRQQYEKLGKQANGKIDFSKINAVRAGVMTPPDAVHAAWLYRLGQNELAAKALHLVRRQLNGQAPENVTHLQLETSTRNELAWIAFAGMVHAYMARADAEALEHGQRLTRLYPAEAKKIEQTQTLLSELQRRRTAGNFGRNAAEGLPADFAKWTGEKKLSFLLAALDEVDVRQTRQTGGVDLASDWRVRELIKLGEMAAPALIDTIEKDDRLTRSVHFWNEFESSRTVLQVRDAALVAVMDILRTQFFDPANTAGNVTGQGKEAAEKVANKLRAYWKRFGKLPYDERMMKILTDSSNAFPARREAAQNLATIDFDRMNAGTNGPRQSPNPVIKKFISPTVAEAILATMDQDLAAYDKKKPDENTIYTRGQIEDGYIGSLVELGDVRIAAELEKRGRTTKLPRMSRKWTFAAHLLGKSASFKEYVRDFHNGRITPEDITKNNGDESEELLGIIDYLANSKLPEANQALQQLTNPKHPFAAVAADHVLHAEPANVYDRDWYAHPYCLSILRRELDNKKFTDILYVIDGDRLLFRNKEGGGSGPIPEFLADPKSRHDAARETLRDRAAMKVQQLVFGIPDYHPLQKNVAKRRKDIMALLDRFKDKLTLVTPAESEALHLTTFHPVYIPRISPLSTTATAKDVAEGRAVFHLDGKGQLVKTKLPLTAVFQRDAKKEYPPRVLIVQAERRPDGVVMYGVIGPKGMRAVPASELTGLKGLDEKKE